MCNALGCTDGNEIQILECKEDRPVRRTFRERKRRPTAVKTQGGGREIGDDYSTGEERTRR